MSRLGRDARVALFVAFVAFGARPAAAAPDAESEAVDALLKSDARGLRAAPDDDALDRLLASSGCEPWLLVEHLLAREKQDIATRVARRTDEKRVGPVTVYSEAHNATLGGAERARSYLAGLSAKTSGKVDAALAHLERVRAVEGAASVFGASAAALRGELLAATGRRIESIEAWLAGGEEALRIGWWAAADRDFKQAGESAYAGRSLDLLARASEGMRALMELNGDGPSLAAAEQNLGSVAEARGDFPGAARHFGESMSLYEALGQDEDVAQARSLRSRVLAQMGEFRSAIEEQHVLALHYAERSHDAAWAENQVNLGIVRTRLGDERGGSDAFAQALEAFRALGDHEGEGHAQGNLGVAFAQTGSWAEAIEAYRAALTKFEAAGDAIGVATAKIDVADALRAGAEFDLSEASLASDAAASEAARAKARSALSDARKLVEEALPNAKIAGAAGLTCLARQTLGQILLAQGQTKEAVESLESTRDEAGRLRAWNAEVASTVALARARLAAEDWPGALREARRAAVQLASAFGGLADADIARAQSLTPDAYDIGVRAAMRSKSLDDLVYFLEAGRAAALLRGLGGRAAALRATVPLALELRLVAASRAKVEAFSAWQKAKTGELSLVRNHWKAYDDGRVAEQKVLEEIAQSQLAAADRLAPARLVSIGDVRTRLRATARPGLNQVFVLFNFQDTEGVALLVEESGPRVVTYARADLARLRDAFAILSASRDGMLDAAALAVVKRSLIEPLKLRAGPTRLFVCPDRDLAYVPLAAILPDDWEFAWEPSATTYDLLAERRVRKGKATFGLGDPDYHTAPDPDALKTRGGPRLTPLPGTRAEVSAIAGGPDDRRLFGAEATERGLTSALEAAGPDRPWKSVHFACHGLVDVEWPALSCLAITPGDGEDGFLTSSEVLRLALRTDLTVLSACQTGRGRFVRGEGAMSLARSFMFAGAARVIASMWDVDDEATAFLMKEFYREWTAGRGTAQALRLAQLAVRDHEVKRSGEDSGKSTPTTVHRPWSDPKFWAAWVLWGLAD